jgi:hypothetical protein
MIQAIQDVFPDQKPINRTSVNTWEEPLVTIRADIGSAAPGMSGTSA